MAVQINPIEDVMCICCSFHILQIYTANFLGVDFHDSIEKGL